MKNTKGKLGVHDPVSSLLGEKMPLTEMKDRINSLNEKIITAYGLTSRLDAILDRLAPMLKESMKGEKESKIDSGYLGELNQIDVDLFNINSSFAEKISRLESIL